MIINFVYRKYKSKDEIVLRENRTQTIYQFQIDNLNLNLSIENLSFDFDSDIFEVLKEALIQANNNKDILEIFIPSLEKIVSKNILELCNNICKHFTFDELLPDRE